MGEAIITRYGGSESSGGITPIANKHTIVITSTFNNGKPAQNILFQVNSGGTWHNYASGSDGKTLIYTNGGTYTIQANNNINGYVFIDYNSIPINTYTGYLGTIFNINYEIKVPNTLNFQYTSNTIFGISRQLNGQIRIIGGGGGAGGLWYGYDSDDDKDMFVGKNGGNGYINTINIIPGFYNLNIGSGGSGGTT